MELRVLGPLVLVGRDGAPVAIGGPKERALLAYLAVHAGQVVSEDRLVDILWGNAPPRTATRTLQSYLSRLRKFLAETGEKGGVVLTSHPGGWSLRLAPHVLDVARVEALLARGRAAAESDDQLGAALAFSDALRAWRGRPLEEFADRPWAVLEAARLEEVRQLIVEERIEAELACGRHAEVVSELEPLCGVHPLRERLWRQRMVALYRSGRRSDALQVVQELRRRLGDGLGIDPSPDIVRLEQSILAQDPSLDWQPPSSRRAVPTADDGPSRRAVTTADDAPSRRAVPTADDAPTRQDSDLAGNEVALPPGCGAATFLFTDMVGSTELLDQLGDDAFEAVRRDHFLVLRDAVASAGGSEVKTLGDGLMAVFASAYDAVGCAVAIQQAVARRNRRTAAGRFGLRVGLHAGEAVRDEADYFGTPVVVAKRLCDAAEAGQIVASRLVAELVGSRGDCDFVTLGPLSLKGISTPVEACTLRWAEQASSPLPAELTGLQQTPFVGRGVERAGLEAAWRRVQGGRLEVVLVSGEPGIGKTTLVVHAALAAGGQGAVVLFGRCDEEAVVPFQPFVESLSQYVESCSGEVLRRQLGAQAADLALLVPGVARRLPELVAVAGTGAESERYRMFEAVSALFAAVGAEAPVVLVLDDLHWADRPTLQLLQHVIRRGDGVALLVLGTYRDTDLVRTHPMAETLADLRRASLVARVPLRGLSDSDVLALVAGGSPARAAEVELAGALWAETEGSPLFLREILRHLEETGSLVREPSGRWVARRRIDQLGIPEGVKEVIGRRLTRLSEAANTALRTGSVLGREVRLDVLEAVTDLSVDELLDAFDEATAAGVVDELAGGAGRWAFTHALVRQALYDELSLTRRVRLHQRVGEALEALHAGGGHGAAGPYLAELAFHFSQAAVAGGADKAIGYARRAGQYALTLAAYEEAARHFAMAVEVSDDAGVDAATTADLLLAQGDAEMHAGDTRVARATFERVVALVAASDPERLARAALGYAGAEVRPIWVEIGVINERAVGLLECALAALPDGDSDLRARLLACLAQELYFLAGADARRDELSATAVAMARRLADPATLAYVLSARNLAILGSDTAKEGLANTSEMLELAGTLGDRQIEAHALRHRFWASCDLDDMPSASVDLDRWTELVEELKDPVARGVGGSLRGGLAMMEGRFEEAEAVLRDAFYYGQEVRDPNAFVGFGLPMALLRMLQGRAEEIVNPMIVAAEMYPPMQSWADVIVAGAYSEIGMYDEAAARLHRVDLADRAVLPRDVLWLLALGMASRTCYRFANAAMTNAAMTNAAMTNAAIANAAIANAAIANAAIADAAVANAAMADTAYRLLLPYADRNAMAATVGLGSVQGPLALAAVAAGRLDDAEQHFEAAIAANARNRWRPWVADTQFFFAAMLAERAQDGDDERALGLVDDALATAADLGMATVSRDGAALRDRLLGGSETAPPSLRRRPAVTRRDRARAKVTARGRAAVAYWTRHDLDDELVRRFGSDRAQRGLFAAMARSFQPAMAFGFNGDLVFELRPPDDELDPAAADWWTIEIRGRKATARRGRSDTAGVTLHAGLAHFVRIASGEIHPVQALMKSTIEVEGDFLLAARLPDMFGAVAPVEGLAAAGSA